jgi:hypothetical protein
MTQNYFETNTKSLFAADFDYFRIPRAQWELMLIRLKQMGVNAVAITVPWGFHEFQQGTIDLEGTTSARRDVVGLLDLCTIFDLPCLLKPGPYSDSGVLGEGIPVWLLSDADDLDDRLPVAVKSWYKTLSKVLANQQWPDGPIIAIQTKSEPTGGQRFTLSEQLTDVKWPIWLRKRYDGIEDLNAAYGAKYRTVSDVEFPQTWADESTPLEKDAKLFLDEVQGESLTGYARLLVDAGWQTPIYPSVSDTPPYLPLIHPHSLTAPDLPIQDWRKKTRQQVIFNLQHPVQVDPDPVEVGEGSVWAENAPIRADGSVRKSFWSVRYALWGHALSKAVFAEKGFNVVFKDGLLATCRGDTSLKVETTAGPKTIINRLRLNGELVTDTYLKVSRGKLGGLYVAEDEVSQTDLIFLLIDSTAPLKGFLLNYLYDLLLAQTQTLSRCARLAERLAETLTLTDEPETAATRTDRPTQTSYTLSEARRGLREADTVLRKAMASVGALEGGFSTILDRPREIIPQPATSPVVISPEVFEGTARDILIEAGDACAKIAPHLKSAEKAVQDVLDSDSGLTIEQYQQSYTTAVTAAKAVRESLVEVLAQLRLEIASERLPLVTWRIHNQVQAIAESLRWGVLRG